MAGMFDWFWNMLSAMGFGNKEARILILGASHPSSREMDARVHADSQTRRPADGVRFGACRAGQRREDHADLPAQVRQDQQLHPDAARQHRGVCAFLRPALSRAATRLS